MGHWSTDEVAEGQRFAYWREVVCDTLLHVTTHAAPAGFSGHVTAHAFGPVRLARFTSTPHEVVRSRRQAEAERGGCYLLSLPRRGRSHVAQSDESLVVEPGGIILIDDQQPFEARYPDEVDRLMIVMPHALLEERAPWLGDRRLRDIGRDMPFAGVVAHEVTRLVASAAHLDSERALAGVARLAQLLAHATEPNQTAGRDRADRQLAAAMAFGMGNLGNAELSPALVAEHLGISLRTLHLRFELTGQTFGRWLLRNRLDACARTIQDPAQHGRSISDIAFGTGFNDLSHFNRTFRERFAMSPRQWRRRSATPSRR